MFSFFTRKMEEKRERERERGRERRPVSDDLEQGKVAFKHRDGS